MLSTFVRRFTTWFETTCKAVSALPDGERVLPPRAAVAEMAPSIGLPPSLDYPRLCEEAFRELQPTRSLLLWADASG